MKVAIDVSPLKTGHKYRGIGAYTERLVKALSREAGSRSAGHSIKVPDFSLSAIDRSCSAGQLIEKRGIPKDVDLVHYPSFDFFWLTLPFRKPKPTVVTIHDVTPLVFPGKFPKGMRGWLKLQAQKFSLKGVSAVITDSKNSKKDITKYLEYPGKRIYVVALAPGDEFKLIKSTKILNSIKVKYDLPKRFVLYVGDVNWNKNVEGLIRAFHKLKVKEKDLELVLVGKAFEDKNLKETRLILQLIKELNLIDQTGILGFVPAQDLAAIYNLATVYCQPSFYEGFGLPVLEAMTCGCPVVAANTASLPETCGDAAIMVDPHKIGKISDGLIRVIGDDKLRRSLIQKGLRRAKKFFWQKVAEETVNVYQKVLARQ